MAKAKASAMDLAVPSAEATAFAPLPGWQSEPTTRASVAAMAMATASASASALACTAATQQVSVSSYLKWPLWQAQRMNVLNKTLSRGPPPSPGLNLSCRFKPICTRPGVLPYLCNCFDVLALWGLFKRRVDGGLKRQRFLRSR